MTKDLYGEAYFRSYVAESADPRYEKRQRMYRQEIARIEKYKSEGNVLDVGCGTGDFLNLFETSKWCKYGIETSGIAKVKALAHKIIFDFDRQQNAQFDLIVYRGTIQHIEEPIACLKETIRWLKPDGVMVFLATPNTGGICYRLFQDLPMMDPERNFVLFSDRMLRQVLSNLGMEVVEIVFPYWHTPYRAWPGDILKFVARLFGAKVTFAFWGNVFECYAVNRRQ
jgi:ubiquinone/menaquinone biosynthesis C-methylase UbiE